MNQPGARWEQFPVPQKHIDAVLFLHDWGCGCVIKSNHTATQPILQSFKCPQRVIIQAPTPVPLGSDKLQLLSMIG